mmetsp:Transcript_7788/g.16912  ORF Transcript_7788/g.16912 Transcript_7788/m.16912 type:complete len:543 (-) Transcript_7788:42-1670(-)
MVLPFSFSLLVLCLIPGPENTAIGTVIRGRIFTQNKDINPAIGRGYSLATGMMFSKCFHAPLSTAPSFDYTYQFTEIGNRQSYDTNTLTASDIPILVPSPVGVIVGNVHQNDANSTATTTSTHRIQAVMSVDKYYESADESTSYILPQAEALLQSGSYISFIQSCGPMFIRGIRRVSQINAMFRYETKSSISSESETTHVIVLAAAALPVPGAGAFNSYDYEQTDKMALDDKMQIEIQGFGLDLSSPNAHSLMCNSMAEFQLALQTGYAAMLNPQTGVVKSIEVVPWANNIQFQLLAKIQTVLTYPTINADGDTVIKKFPTEIKRFNFLANAEHIAKMEEISRYKYNMINHLQNCMGKLWSETETHLCSHWVQHRKFPFVTSNAYSQNQVPATLTDNVVLESREETLITAARLKYILNGQDDTDESKLPIELAMEEYLNFNTHYYAKCMKKLTEDHYDQLAASLYTKHFMDDGTDGEADNGLFPCNDVLCTMKNTYWDIAQNKCVLRQVDRNWEKMVHNFCSPEYIAAYNDQQNSATPLICT